MLSCVCGSDCVSSIQEASRCPFARIFQPLKKLHRDVANGHSASSLP